MAPRLAWSHESHPTLSAAGPHSPLYPQLLEEALEVCEQHLGVLGHQDIDRSTPSPCRTCIDWDRFLPGYYRVAQWVLSGTGQGARRWGRC